MQPSPASSAFSFKSDDYSRIDCVRTNCKEFVFDDNTLVFFSLNISKDLDNLISHFFTN